MSRGDIGKPDHFYRKAKEEGYAARSVYKLQELDRKYRLLFTGAKVLDLGAAPGSWMTYCAARVGSNGLVVGLDQRPVTIKLPVQTSVVQADVVGENTPHLLESYDCLFDVVLSDMAPGTTGQKEADHHASAELTRAAWRLASKFLKKKGSFVCKIFQGGETNSILAELKSSFDMAKSQKPAASRSKSREIFLLATGYRGLTS